MKLSNEQPISSSSQHERYCADSYYVCDVRAFCRCLRLYREYSLDGTFQVSFEKTLEGTYEYLQGRINHSGAHPNVRWGPLLIRVARIFFFFSGSALFPTKKLTFLVVVIINVLAYTERSNVKTIWQSIRGVAAGPPMVQPAQWLIRPCVSLLNT